jgi:hypothetical protein
LGLCKIADLPFGPILYILILQLRIESTLLKLDSQDD